MTTLKFTVAANALGTRVRSAWRTRIVRPACAAVMRMITRVKQQNPDLPEDEIYLAERSSLLARNCKWAMVTPSGSNSTRAVRTWRSSTRRTTLSRTSSRFRRPSRFRSTTTARRVPTCTCAEGIRFPDEQREELCASKVARGCATGGAMTSSSPPPSAEPPSPAGSSSTTQRHNPPIAAHSLACARFGCSLKGRDHPQVGGYDILSECASD